MIHDLSYPRSDSINSHTDQEYSQVIYDSIDTVIEKVKSCGRSCLMAKTDIANAYRIVPIHPDDRHFLGFSWPSLNGRTYFYQDACLTMGLSMSCQLFTRFSNALQWVMETTCGAIMSHILDDFLFVGPCNSNLCQLSLRSFLEMSEEVGIPIT